MARQMLVALVVALTVGLEASCAEQPALLRDAGFEASGADGLGTWQVRFARKASDPASRPRWKVVSATDEGGDHGRFLSIEETENAAGTVYVGQVVRLPDPLPELELSFDYQTFCDLGNRSGSWAVVLIDAAAWQAMATDPEQGADPPEALFSRQVCPNADDATTWHHARVAWRVLRPGLTPLAGREVAIAAAWTAWHPGNKEWAKVDNLTLGPAEPGAAAQRPEHPCLFYNRAELDRMKAKVAEFDWAEAAYDSLLSSANAWLERHDDPPSEGGGWSHDYVCPDDGARLRFREDHPHQHLCPTCGKEWAGPKLDACWRASMHGQFSGGARDLALAYQLTGDQKYGRAAARILVWYADHYADFPPGHGPAGRGRVMSQSLSECSWLIGIMDAADLAWRALTEAEQTHLEDDLVLAGADQIRAFTFGIHNIQCWHNACYACAGYFLGDREMVAAARGGKLGFDQQVAKGILADGMWFERSLGYHNYTLSALINHCEAARHNGDDLYQEGRIKDMFLLPLRLAQPNLVPPSLNDQGYSTSSVAAEPLELAVAWYHDEEAMRALRLLYGSGGEKRGGRLTWHYGETLPEGDVFQPPGSRDMPGVGMAILRQGDGPAATCAMLEYGEHGGGHGHPDKLQLILYGLGRTLCPDPGTTGYGVPLHGRWFKTTVGHNTLTIGHVSQKPTTGELTAFEDHGTWSAATATADAAYPGWRLTRRLLLSGNFLVDELIAEGDQADTLDWFLRAPGELTLRLDTAPLTEEPPNATYAYLTDLQAADTAETWSATWAVDDDGGRLQATMLGEPGTRVARCLAPGIPGQAKWQTLRVRRMAAATRFVVVYQMLAEGQGPVAVVGADGAIRVGGVMVTVPEGRDGAMAVR